ncbi:MAG: hypothetical protein Q4F05_09120 [bacterium]|nr:hypothetical protein [bacterium]
MIYKKDANFPYPLLTNTSNSYENCEFTLDVQLQENTNSYLFTIDYTIDSEFVKQMLERNKAKLILVIQSKDNRFFELNYGESKVEINRSRISLNKRTTIQLLIQAKEEISLSENEELSPFYTLLKDELSIPKHGIVGFSNLVIFEGSNEKPMDLFEKKLNPSLSSDIRIDLSSETIIINYKNESLQFSDSSHSGALNNTYVYMGMQKALYRFILTYGEDGVVTLAEISIPEDGLDFKLYNLMNAKMVDELAFDNIDEVIYTISDKILEKYANAVRRLYQSGN